MHLITFLILFSALVHANWIFWLQPTTFVKHCGTPTNTEHSATLTHTKHCDTATNTRHRGKLTNIEHSGTATNTRHCDTANKTKHCGTSTNTPNYFVPFSVKLKEHRYIRRPELRSS